MGILQWSGYLGRGRGHNGPDEAPGQPNVAAEDEAASLGTSRHFGQHTRSFVPRFYFFPSYLRSRTSLIK